MARFPVLESLIDPAAFTVVDAGGRGGFSLLPQLHSYCDLFSFEPDTESWQALRERYAKKHPFRNVALSGNALSDTNGTATFYSAKHPSMSSLLPPDLARFEASFGEVRHSDEWMKGMQTAKTFEVKTETLSSFAETRQLHTIDFLKLDTQGSELQILRGAEKLLREKRIGMIFTEVLMLPVYEEQAVFSEIDQYLRGIGYRFIDLRVYAEAVARENTWSAQLQEQPKYAMGGDAVYVPDFSTDGNGIAPARSAILLAALGYFSDSKDLLQKHCGKNQTEIEALFREVMPPQQHLKRFALRWLPPALARMISRRLR